MTDAAVISGTFTKIESISTRKVVRLHIECPVELADQVLEALGGYPDASNPVHVAVARLNPEAVQKPQEKWKPDHESVVKTCVLTCQKPTFWQFVYLSGHHCENEKDAAEYVRYECGVNTRADLATNPVALRKWQTLEHDYTEWLSDSEAA